MTDVAEYFLSTDKTKPHPLISPIDVSRVKKEEGVKSLIKRLLNFHGWFTWMPAANGFGTSGVLDHLAFKDGVFMVIEAKFGTNKPTVHQRQFAQQIMVNDGYAFLVTERNIDFLAMFLESFEIAAQHNQRRMEVPAEHGARMLNAISVLTDGWAVKS